MSNNAIAIAGNTKPVNGTKIEGRKEAENIFNPKKIESRLKMNVLQFFTRFLKSQNF